MSTSELSISSEHTNSLELERFLSFNSIKRRFSWNSTVENLEKFIKHLCYSEDDDKERGKLTKSSNGTCAVFKVCNATFNFYPNTKTLQVQGSSSQEIKNLLEQIANQQVQPERPQEDNGGDLTINGGESVINESTLSESDHLDLTRNDSVVLIEGNHDIDYKNEIGKLWNAINSINCKLESPAVPPKCQTALEGELNEYKLKCSRLEEKVSELEQERASLLEALRILSTETVTVQNSAVQQVQHDAPPCQLWETIRPKQDQGKKKKKTSHQEQQISRKDGSKLRARSASSGKHNRQPERESSSRPSGMSKRPTVVIAGDSMLKNIQGWRVSKKTRTVVKSFPGATVEDMFDYIKPTIKHQPEEIIVHVGTNDIKNSGSPRSVAERIVDLGNMIESETPNTKVTISCLLNRSDEASLAPKVNEINKILKTFAKQSEWNILNHENIVSEHLNSSGLHLNVAGTKLFASNFVNYIRNN